MSPVYGKLLKSLVPITLVAFSLLPLFANDDDDEKVAIDGAEVVEKMLVEGGVAILNETDAVNRQQDVVASDNNPRSGGSLRGVSSRPKNAKMAIKKEDMKQESP